ncbi:adenylate/guanylate cyclase domain-containing protein [Aquihabitans sp. G128]|uniref:adenylate/guanylate cyclase domain-containing protein n=1 Tax=Aquihabitans sp. G128 TaxID=2849779 RepID=UPI001C240FBB|nr:adenylate/guanylate cyclase domain-containing protein [Aquihabitans sp. G128]QXC63280.1 adenylate/guanylate cyclase domain-containing protein [Aquihabitans sp. G128]
MAPVERAKVVGEQALASLRRSVSERLADLIRSDPAWASQAADVGLIDRAWLEAPGSNPFRTAPPTEMVQRFLERSSEQRPSVLSSVGLSALQGLSLVRAEAADPAAPAPITVMFTDLEGFTRFTAEHGDEVAAALVAGHQRVVGPIVRSRGGRIVKRLGDGLMLTFPAPEAAVLAALELVEAVEAPLKLRAGLHVGEAVMTHDDLFGNVVNVAARITEEAKGHMVLASVDVREQVAPLAGVRFGRARRARLKGVEPMSLCRIERDLP